MEEEAWATEARELRSVERYEYVIYKISSGLNNEDLEKNFLDPFNEELGSG